MEYPLVKAFIDRLVLFLTTSFIVFSLSVCLFFTKASGDTPQLDSAVQEMEAYSLSRNTVPFTPSVNLGGVASYSFVSKGTPSSMFLRIHTRSGSSQEIDVGKLAEPPEIVMDQKRGYLAFVDRTRSPATLKLVDFSSDMKVVSAEVPYGSTLNLFKDKLILVNGYSERVAVKSFSYDGAALHLSNEAELYSKSLATGAYVVPEGDHLGVYFDEPGKVDRHPQLVSVLISEDGHKLRENVYPKYRIQPYEIESSADHSFSTSGTLLPLYQNGEQVSARGIYRIDSAGQANLVSNDGIFAAWTKSRDILINRGKHASSSELLLLKAPLFDHELKIAQPVGYKKGISVNDGDATYLNVSYTDPIAVVSSPLDAKTSFTIVAQGPVSLPQAKLPKVVEVEYRSGNREVPSVLSLPAELQTRNLEGKKLPAIVYIHGGNETDRPHGQNMGTYDDDHLMFSQLGYVVLDANYFGNEYLGRKYKNWKGRLFQNEGVSPQLEDIQAAGEYVKSLPYVDPSKVVLFGHSYGATLSSLYLGTKKFQEESPFSSAVLRGGVYTQESLANSGLRVYTSPRLVTGPTDEHQNIFPRAEKDGNRVYHPEEPIYNVNEALTKLQQLRSHGQDYFGVLYFLPDSFYQKTVPVQVAKDFPNKPIYIMHGVDDSFKVSDAKALATIVSTATRSLETWYPENAGHLFKGNVREEMLHRIQKFVSELGSKNKIECLTQEIKKSLDPP